MSPAGGPGWVLALLALHGILAALAGPIVSRLGRRGFAVLAVPPAALLVAALAAAPRVLDGRPVTERLAWAPSLGFDITVSLDGFSLLMLALVSGIGVLVLAYAAAYLGERPDLGRIGGLLLAFGGAMAGLVVVDNLLAVFLFWEATSFTSYLLIGIEDRSATARAAALRALLTTGAGGLAMLGGFVLLYLEGGTWSLSGLVADPPTGTLVDVALVLVLAGAFTKSAQFPFHYWLPGAMVAPTPVSAYLHSATMVKAGVYLIARLAPGFADAAPWRPLVVVVGLVTLFVGGWRALSQTDLKLLLAHGTTSQLGLLVVLFGLGFEDATLAGATLLLAHALFKAALFMVVGIVDHQAHTRDARRLSALHRSMPVTTTLAVIGAASMAGLPPLLGFVAKEGAFEALLHVDAAWGSWALAGVVGGSVLTVAYSARMVWGMVGPEVPGVAPAKGEVQDPSEAGWQLVAPVVVLSAGTVLGGLYPRTVSSLVVGGARALMEGVGHAALELWHGFGTALVLSAIVFGLGWLAWRVRDLIEGLQRRLPHLPTGGRIFDIGVARLLRGADVFIGHVQTGSLPLYLMVILATVLLVPGVALLLGVDSLPDAALADHPGQLATVALVGLAAVGAVVLRQRLAAVICVGAVGYGMAVLFLLQGAPDLALTQVLVETLLLVLFVLVLRHLPSWFAPNQTWLSRWSRALLSTLIGALAAIFVLVAYSARPDVVPVGERYLAESPEAGGKNVVNAILVEFRSFDTLGETAVVTVTALGVLGLVRAARRERDRSTDRAVEPWRPSFVLDAAVRALFRVVLLFSVVLLLAGHDEPGGGFIGGLVAGCAFMLLYLAGGDPTLRRREPLAAEAFLGLGISLAALAGAVGWLIGGDYLESAALHGTVPGLGELKLSSGLVFDTGVYLVVIGLVLALLRSIGREEVQER